MKACQYLITVFRLFKYMLICSFPYDDLLIFTEILDHLGGEFLEFVFGVVENPPNQDDKITDGFMNLLFAYNLQFSSVEDNLIISTLEERLNANVFTQKVIYFLNREGLDFLKLKIPCVFKL